MDHRQSSGEDFGGDSGNGGAKQSGPWYVRLDPKFIVEGMASARNLAPLLIQLAHFARKRRYCFVTEKTIARRLGLSVKSTGAVRDLIRKAEAAGWIASVHADDKRTLRIGFVLLKRVDSERCPAAATPEEVEQARSDLIRKFLRHRDASIHRNRVAKLVRDGRLSVAPPSPQKTETSSPQNPAVASPQKTAGKVLRSPLPSEELKTVGMMITESPSSSPPSVSGDGGGETSGTSADPLAADAIADALVLFGDTPAIRSRAEADAREYGGDWLGRAVGRVRRQLDRKRIKEAEWSYVRGILANWRREGGPPPTAKPKPKPRELSLYDLPRSTDELVEHFGRLIPMNIPDRESAAVERVRAFADARLADGYTFRELFRFFEHCDHQHPERWGDVIAHDRAVVVEMEARTRAQEEKEQAERAQRKAERISQLKAIGAGDPRPDKSDKLLLAAWAYHNDLGTFYGCSHQDQKIIEAINGGCYDDRGTYIAF